MSYDIIFIYLSLNGFFLLVNAANPGLQKVYNIRETLWGSRQEDSVPRPTDSGKG